MRQKMKNIFYTILLLLLLSLPLKSQWGTEIPLYQNVNLGGVSVATSNNYIHLTCTVNANIVYKSSSDYGLNWSNEILLFSWAGYGVTPSIAVWGSNVYVVAYYSSGIYYKFSTDNGLNWSHEIFLTPTNYCEPKIKVYGNNIHIVWDDNYNGKRVIFYKHSTDNGNTWSENIRLTNENSSSGPSIAVEGNNVHLVWTDFRDGHQEVYYKRSTNNGFDWSDDIRLTYDLAHSGSPDISVYDQNIHIVWVDDRNPGPLSDIYYKRSTDNGVTWSEDRRLSYLPYASGKPSISVYGNFINVVWGDRRINGIMFKRSTDGGAIWDSEYPLTSSGFNSIVVNSNYIIHVFYSNLDNLYYKRSFENGSSIWEITTLVSHNRSAYQPDISSSGSMVYVSWTDYRNTFDYHSDIYFKYSSDGGISWSQDIRLTFDSTNYRPVIKSYENNVYLAYEKFHHVGQDIYFKNSFNNGLNWNTKRMTYDSASSRPTMAVDGNNIHLAYESFRNNRNSIFYRRSTNNGNNWNDEVLINNFTDDYSSSPFITCSGSNVYIVWVTKFDYYGPSLILFKKSTDNGISWSSYSIIDTGFSPHIAVSGNYLHLVYQTLGNDIYYCRSTDNGLTWSTPSYLEYGGLPKITVMDSDLYVIFVSGYGMYYLRSTDNGQSWEPRKGILYSWDPRGQILYGVNLSNSLNEVHLIWDDINGPKSDVVYTKITKWLTTKVEQVNNLNPNKFYLYQNYPNPFNAETKIRFSLPENSNVSLKIYNVLGEEIETLVNDYLTKGQYEINWNAFKYSSGIYFYRLQTDKWVETRKMVLLK